MSCWEFIEVFYHWEAPGLSFISRVLWKWDNRLFLAVDWLFFSCYNLFIVYETNLNLFLKINLLLSRACPLFDVTLHEALMLISHRNSSHYKVSTCKVKLNIYYFRLLLLADTYNNRFRLHSGLPLHWHGSGAWIESIEDVQKKYEFKLRLDFRTECKTPGFARVSFMPKRVKRNMNDFGNYAEYLS